MNYQLVFRLMATVSVLLGASMSVCLPWALPYCGGIPEHEMPGVHGLLLSIAFCFALGAIFKYISAHPALMPRRRTFSSNDLYRRETILIVAMSWILSCIFGALPYLFTGAYRAEGVPMSIVDALFESQSGFSTTGASVITELENPKLLPRCILFWRGMSNFVGGLGIIVLFVALLGSNPASKSIFRTDMSGPKSQSPQIRVQQTALFLVSVYLALNAVLTLLLWLMGLTFFDALCHSFATIATGGLSTFNASVGHFAVNTDLNAPLIEWTIIVFMILGGTRFMLFYWIIKGLPSRLWGNTEFRVYIGIIIVASLIVFASGHFSHDFDQYGMTDRPIHEKTLKKAPEKELLGDEFYADLPGVAPPERLSVHWTTELRSATFQTVTILTTTGFNTDEFSMWNPISRACLFFLLLCGGCAGSTSGNIKVIRVVLCAKIIIQEIERYFRPNVVRGLWLDGEPLSEDVRRSVPIFIVLYTFIVFIGAFSIITSETLFVPENRGSEPALQIVGALHCSLSAMGNVGPAQDATANFGHFTEWSKFTFVILMLLGRQEIFIILALCLPSFWRGA